MDYQDFPKMLYKNGQTKIVKNAEEQSSAGAGWTTQAPSQFEDESAGGEDPTREPAIVSQIEQEKTRLAGNQGAKDPAQLLADEENGDESSEDPEPAPLKPAAKKGK